MGEGTRGGKNLPRLLFYQEAVHKAALPCHQRARGAATWALPWARPRQSCPGTELAARSTRLGVLARGGAALLVDRRLLSSCNAVQGWKLMLNPTLECSLFRECFESILALKIRCQKGGWGGGRVLILRIVTLKMITKKKNKKIHRINAFLLPSLSSCTMKIPAFFSPSLVVCVFVYIVIPFKPWFLWLTKSWRREGGTCFHYSQSYWSIKEIKNSYNITSKLIGMPLLNLITCIFFF